MRRVVIDTNVLIRAFLKKTGNDYLVYQQFLDGKIDMYYSRLLVDEFMDVISRPRLMHKYKLAKAAISLFWEDIFQFGKLKVPQKVHLCRDPRDDHVIGLAMRAAKKESAYLVTADEDILALAGTIKNIHILTAAEFIRT